MLHLDPGTGDDAYTVDADRRLIVPIQSETIQEDDPLPTAECGPGCPLRKAYIPTTDAPLPLADASLAPARKEACAQLYSALKQWQPRLLLLDPGEFGTSVSASLIVVDVVHLPGAVLHEKQQLVRFAALSYTWGVAEFPRSITINNIVTPVTEILYAFIQRYRSRHECLYIWVDAICINQFDLDEKATQVSQMLAIFERAHTVIVWLGEEGPNTRLAVDYLHWAKTEGLDTPLTTNKYYRPENAGRLARIVNPNRIGHTMECLRLLSQVLNGIQDICSRKWVRRIVREPMVIILLKTCNHHKGKRRMVLGTCSGATSKQSEQVNH